MADSRQLALLKSSVKEWNAWRKANPNDKADLDHANLKYANLSFANLYQADLSFANFYQADLRGADLRNADLYQADLRNADLSGAKFSGANLYEANLRGANLSDFDLSAAILSGADLTNATLKGANLNSATLRGTNLSNADLRGTELTHADLSNAILTGAKRDAPPPKSAASEPHQGSSSPTTDWLNLVETYGGNLFVAAATLASIIQGLDVVERRWREHQEKHKQQGSKTPQPASASSTQAASPPQKAATSDKEIVEILLVMDDGSQHGFKRWVSDPDALRTYIDAFSDPKSPVKPFQVIFRKREGRSLVVNVTEGGKDNQQLNVILGYLDADP
jgi:hypothetical protein